MRCVRIRSLFHRHVHVPLVGRDRRRVDGGSGSVWQRRCVMTRIVVTSGDPATGVVGIKQAPTSTAEFGDDVVIGPVSLPATDVKVEQRCPKCRGTGRGFDWLLRVVPCRKCHGTRFVVLGTATLRWIGTLDETYEDDRNMRMPFEPPYVVSTGEHSTLWVSRDQARALAPSLGLVAYLTDWNPT